MDVRFLFVVGYLLLMVGVSLYLKRKMVKSSDDFAVAGRRFMIVLVGTLLGYMVRRRRYFGFRRPGL